MVIKDDGQCCAPFSKSCERLDRIIFDMLMSRVFSSDDLLRDLVVLS